MAAKGQNRSTAEENMYWKEFESNRHQFFKRMDGEFKHHLRIPRKFMNNFRENLSGTIHLRGPSGFVWSVELERIFDDHLVLLNGWEIFAKDHRLAENDVLVFQYDENSTFNVVVFDKNGCEREGSYFVKKNMQKEKINKKGRGEGPSSNTFYSLRRRKAKEKQPQVVESSDDETEVLSMDESDVASGSEMEASEDSEIEPVPSKHQSKSRKKGDPRGMQRLAELHESHKICFKSNRRVVTEEEKRRPCKLARQHSSTRPSFSMIMRDSYVYRKKGFGCIPFNFKFSVTKGGLASRLMFFNKRVCENEPNPFFEVEMTPNFIDPGRKMCIPKDFATKYLKKGCSCITLHTLDGKTWSAKCSCYVSCGKYTKAVIYSGWKEFRLDNELKVGDTCVFELINQTETSFNVVIYGSSLLGRRGFSKRPLTPSAKAIVLQRAGNFKTEKPFFKVVMQPAYLKGGRVYIPYKFIKKHLGGIEGHVILQDPDKGVWTVKLSIRVMGSGQHKAEFCGTWKGFVMGNNLQVGDVSIFELIGKKKRLFKVSIFPAASSSSNASTFASVSPQGL